MPVYKDPKPTKNGKCWFYKINYQDAFGQNKQTKSKKYLTEKEPQEFLPGVPTCPCARR